MKKLFVGTSSGAAKGFLPETVHRSSVSCKTG